MKLVLSRKGFDSSAGGFPSPIFPDGRMLSLPIPDKQGLTTYKDIATSVGPMSDLLQQLGGQHPWCDTPAHLDPDLRSDALPRLPGWQPTLGQTGAAQSHLRNQAVSTGDLFLFFGLFKPIEKTEHGWRFQKGALARHVLWGWMQIGAIHRIDELPADALPWARYHPHFQLSQDANNTLYQAAAKLNIAGISASLPGSGVFDYFRPELSLTAADARTPSQWALPSFFYPSSDKPPLSYHSKPERWQKTDTQVTLQAAARGQEFVLDTHYYPDTTAWLASLLRH